MPDQAANSEQTPQRRGLFAHPVGFWFFFWGEFAERCSYYGMRAILALYMSEQLGLGEANSALYMSFFISATYFLPLLGGWVADRFFGKYWTIVGFSLPYILGHVILGVEDFWYLVVALILLAMGSGVIKPNISTLMGLTYDQQRPGQTQLRSDGFAIFYFSINIGAALSQFAMPPIRTAFGYAYAFLFPAALMVIAFIIFALGKKHYGKETVGVKLKTPEERTEQWRVLGRICLLFFLVMFFWAIFDQSASTWIFFTQSCMDRHVFGYQMDADQMQAVNPLLILILLPPITMLWHFLRNRGLNIRATDKINIGFFLTGVCMVVMALAAWLAGQAELRPGVVEAGEGAVAVAGSDAKEMQGKIKVTVKETNQVAVSVKTETMDEENKKKKTVETSWTVTGEGELRLVPDPDNATKAMAIEGVIAKIEEADGDDKKLVAERPAGLTITATTGELDVENRWFVAPERQVTVWWLVLAYIIITTAEICVSVTGLELAYTAAPKHMTGFVTGCWLVTVGLANLIINAPVTQLYPMMQPVMYFGMLAAMMFVVFIGFLFVAKRFNRGEKSQADAPPTSEAETAVDG